MTATPEPNDKLGTMTTQRVAETTRRAITANGPEDDVLDWDAVDWRAAEDDPATVGESMPIPLSTARTRQLGRPLPDLRDPRPANTLMN